jgi:hypothetical protein
MSGDNGQDRDAPKPEGEKGRRTVSQKSLGKWQSTFYHLYLTENEATKQSEKKTANKSLRVEKNGYFCAKSCLNL